MKTQSISETQADGTQKHWTSITTVEGIRIMLEVQSKEDAVELEEKLKDFVMDAGLDLPLKTIREITKAKEKLSIDTFRTKKSELNWDEEEFNETNCCCCGKKVINPKTWLRVVDFGERILHPEEEKRWDEEVHEDNDKDTGSLEDGDLGLLVVGENCKSKFKGWTREF